MRGFPVDEYFGEGEPPPVYNQPYVDGLKKEIEHYKKLYRDELIRTKQLERKISNAKRL